MTVRRGDVRVPGVGSSRCVSPEDQTPGLPSPASSERPVWADVSEGPPGRSPGVPFRSTHSRCRSHPVGQVDPLQRGTLPIATAVPGGRSAGGTDKDRP